MMFYMPTRVISERDCVKNFTFCASGKKALIITGKNSAKACGALDDVVDTLDKQNVGYALYDNILNNPSVESIFEAIKKTKGLNFDFIIAIGGGSPMDAAKAFNLILSNRLNEDEIFTAEYKNNLLPMCFIPTTAGTGSEVTPYSVLTNNKLKTKQSIASPFIFPNYALCDSKYIKNLPKHIMTNTVIDALSHAIEGMISLRANNATDALAEKAISMIYPLLEKLDNLCDTDRDALMQASTIAGMVIANTGTCGVHSMGYSLTYFHNVDHGQSNGILMGEFLKFINNEKVEKILSACKDDLFGFTNKLKKILSPLSIQCDFELYADIALKTKNVYNSNPPLDKESIIKIYKSSI